MALTVQVPFVKLPVTTTRLEPSKPNDVVTYASQHRESGFLKEAFEFMVVMLYHHLFAEQLDKTFGAKAKGWHVGYRGCKRLKLWKHTL